MLQIKNDQNLIQMKIHDLIYVVGYNTFYRIHTWCWIALALLLVGLTLYSENLHRRGLCTTGQRFVLITLPVYYTFLFLSAVISRRHMPEVRVNLDFLWSYRAALTNQDGAMALSILGNIVAFFVLGALTAPFCRTIRKRSSFLRTVVAGFTFSLTIELSQFFLHTGTVELDDLFSNTLGTALGHCFCWICKRATVRRRDDSNKGKTQR